MLNTKVVIYILGRLILMEAIFMALTIPVSLFYKEGDSLMMGVSTLITLFGALVLILVSRKPDRVFGKREGFLVVTLSWFIFSLFGSLPFILTGAIPDFTNAFFGFKRP